MSYVSDIEEERHSSSATPSWPRVLIVEDDLALLKGLELNLKKEGYELLKAATGRSAIDIATRRNPDLILLDVMLPDMSGLDVCRTIRQSRLDCVVIMLTVKAEELDRVLGLEIGADDYVTKPFSLRELLARIRAHMRRRPAKSADVLTQFAFGDIEVNFETSYAKRKDKEVTLTGKELELLRFLISHRGEVVTREQMLQRVWGFDFNPTTRTVDNHVLRLRQKLEVDPKKPRYILSAYGEGYRFQS